jgi:hypothetical protein
MELKLLALICTDIYFKITSVFYFNNGRSKSGNFTLGAETLSTSKSSRIFRLFCCSVRFKYQVPQVQYLSVTDDRMSGLQFAFLLPVHSQS